MQHLFPHPVLGEVEFKGFHFGRRGLVRPCLVFMPGSILCNVVCVLLVAFAALDALATLNLKRAFQPDAKPVLGKEVTDLLAVHASVFSAEKDVVRLLGGVVPDPAQEKSVALLTVFKRCVDALAVEISSLQYHCIELCFGEINADKIILHNFAMF